MSVPEATAALETAQAALKQAAVDLVMAIARIRLACTEGLEGERPVDPVMPSNPPGDMRLARAFVVQIATARLKTGTPGDNYQPWPQAHVPDGFEPIWGGKAAVQIIALDRDRLGTPVKPLDLVELLAHPGPDLPPGWRTGP